MGKQGKAITLLAPSDLPKWRRMAHNLGQAVSLQRLTIDEQAIVTLPSASPETPAVLEDEQNVEQRPLHSRQYVSPGQERGRLARSEQDDQPASGMKRRPKDRVTGGTVAKSPAWDTEGSPQPERANSGRSRDGRRATEMQPTSGRTTPRHKSQPFTAPEPRHRTGNRRPGARPAERTRWTTSSRRYASR
jgi:hypothetical protein